MSHHALALLLLGGLTAQAEPPKENAPRLDQHGDPLPHAALLRLGTVRFRGQFQAVALSPDGKTLAAGSYQGLQLLDVATGKTLKTFRNERGYGYGSFTFSPDGKMIANADHSGIQLWDVATGQAVRQINGGGRIRPSSAVAFSGDGKLITMGSDYFGQEKASIRVWETATGKETTNVETLQNYSVRAILSTDGKVLATWGQYNGRGDNREEDQRRTRTIQLWDTSNSKEIKKLEMPQYSYISSVSLSRDGKRAVVCSQGTIVLWDVTTGKEIGQFAARRGTHTCMFSPDGKILAGISNPMAVQLWEVESGKRLGLHELPGVRYSNYLTQLVFTPDNRLLSCTTTGQAVAVWDVRAEKRLTPGGGHEMAIAGVAFADGGRNLYSISADGVVLRWDTTTGKELARHQIRDDENMRYGGGGRVNAAIVSPDGKYLLTTDHSFSMLWELTTGREVCSFQGGYSSYGMAAAFSADGSRIVMGGRDRRGMGGTLTVFDVNTGRKLNELTGSLDEVTGLAFSPDGKMVAAASLSHRGNSQYEIRAWDVSTGKSRWHQSQNGYSYVKMAFSPDSSTLAVGSQTGQLALLYASTGEEQRQLGDGSSMGVFQLTFSPDGRMVATASLDNGPNQRSPIINVWEVASGTLRKRMTGYPAQTQVNNLAFSPDGSMLATTANDASVLLWDLTGRLGLEKPKAAVAEKELATLWASLDGLDAQTAHLAMAKLQLSPAEAMTLFAKHLSPIKGPETTQAAMLTMIADLDHARFPRREKARKDLEALGKLAETELRKALGNKPSLEVKKQLEELLSKFEKVAVKPEWVRPIRAVEVMERIGNAEAKKLLETLSTGTPDARLTQEAKAALSRMSKPSR